MSKQSLLNYIVEAVKGKTAPASISPTDVGSALDALVNAMYDNGFFPNMVFVETAANGGSDATGVFGRRAKPYATINAAIDAANAVSTTALVIIRIGIGDFAVPSASKFRSNIWFMGTHMPRYNWTVTLTGPYAETYSAPSKLIDGTVLKGGMNWIGHFHNVSFTDLGIDNGSEFVSGGGTAMNCLGIVSWNGIGSQIVRPPYALMQNIKVERCKFLGSSHTAPYHAIVFENCYNPVVKDVECVGQIWGWVTKCTGGTYDGITVRWSQNGSTIKGNDYSMSSKVILRNFLFTSLDPVAKESGGLELGNVATTIEDAEYPTFNSQITISDGNITHTRYGLNDMGISPSTRRVPFVTISNVHVFNTVSHGFYLRALIKAQLSNCSANHNGGRGFSLTLQGTTTENSLLVTGCAAYRNALANYQLSTGIYGIGNHGDVGGAANVGTFTAPTATPTTTTVTTGILGNLF